LIHRWTVEFLLLIFRDQVNGLAYKIYQQPYFVGSLQSYSEFFQAHQGIGCWEWHECRHKFYHPERFEPWLKSRWLQKLLILVCWKKKVQLFLNFIYQIKNYSKLFGLTSYRRYFNKFLMGVIQKESVWLNCRLACVWLF